MRAPSAVGAQPTGAIATTAARPAICFIALKAYGLLAPRDENARHVGGAEVQQILIAREFQRRGCQVSVIVLDQGQEDGCTFDGIRVWKCFRPNAGLCGLRMLTPRMTGLWAAMRRSGADIYYQRGADWETGAVGLWCAWNHRSFIFASASDFDCDPALPMLDSIFDRSMFRMGLRRASAVLAQSTHQQLLLRRDFNLQSHLVRSCCNSPSDEATKARTDFRALWIGRLSSEKRPEWVLQLARELTECKFDMIGHCNVNSPESRALLEQIRAQPNIAWHGFVPRELMPEFYRRASVVLCTSVREGFPNTYLEAWQHGISVLGTVDPDGVVTTHSLGHHVISFDQMRSSLAQLCREAPRGISPTPHIQSYVRSNHSPAATVDALEAVIHRVATTHV